MLGLIFSLMHQSSLSFSLSQHPVTGILFSLLQLNFISLVLFLLKTLSEWERLNSDNPRLSTHLSIRSFINLSYLTSFLHIPDSPLHILIHTKTPTQMFFFMCFASCLFVSVSSSSFTLHFTHLLCVTTQLFVWSAIHLQTPFPPEQSNSLSPFTQRRLSFHLPSPPSITNLSSITPSTFSW